MIIFRVGNLGHMPHPASKSPREAKARGVATAPSQLEAAAEAVASAVMVLRPKLRTIESFLDENSILESLESVADPALHRDSEMRAISAVMEPIFRAAMNFVRLHDAQAEKAADALARLRGTEGSAALPRAS